MSNAFVNKPALKLANQIKLFHVSPCNAARQSCYGFAEGLTKTDSSQKLQEGFAVSIFIASATLIQVQAQHLMQNPDSSCKADAMEVW